MSTHILSSLTADSLQAGEFATVFPEYYHLTDFIENNPWHLQQSVFDHSVKVMRNFEEIMRFEFLSPELRSRAVAYFQTQAGGISKLDQLKAVVFLHDIAKPLVFKENADGTAGASSLHEALAAAMVGDFQQRLEISDEAAIRIKQMILLHGTVSEFLNISLEKKDQHSFLQLFEKLTVGYTTDLLCFILADIRGSDLDVSMPQAFQERISLLTTWIIERFSSNE